MRRIAFAVMIMMLACAREQDAPPENDASTGDASDTSGTTMIEPTTTTPTEPATGSSGESSTGEDACLGPDGCWNCDPVEPEHLLNQCTEADCEVFPITQERLPLLSADGSLPPIP